MISSEAKIHEPSGEGELMLNALLDQKIYEFNVAATGIRDGKAFAGIFKDESEEIIAAIDGHTWGKCCQIVHLWVHESHRRRGMGSALLKETEKEAQRRGCTQVLLLTHSFQAPSFYDASGYIRHATIPNYPDGYDQHVYLKRF